MLKTHTCGQLRAQDAGIGVALAGWVHRRRDHGGLIFVDLRDRWGITQVVFDPNDSPAAHATAVTLRSEYVVCVRGRVRERPEGLCNPKMDTGKIEVSVDATYGPTVQAGQRVSRGQRLCEASEASISPLCPVSGIVQKVRFDPEDHMFVISIAPDRDP